MKKVGLAILFLAVVALVGGTRLLRLTDSQAIHTSSNADLYLNSKTDLERLSQILSDSLNAVDDTEELKWAANLLGWRTFQPGHYNIDSGYTYDNFLAKLAKGNQDPITLTVVPGQSKDKIFSFLANRMQFDSTSLYQTVYDSTFLAEHEVNRQKMVGHLFQLRMIFTGHHHQGPFLTEFFENLISRWLRPIVAG